MSVEYHVYSNTGIGDPINYSSIIATVSGLTFTTSALTFPGTWQFGVRAFDTVSSLEEQNVDAVVTIVLSATGTDITSQPMPPLGLRAFPLASASVRVEWTQPPSAAAKTPTQFNVYKGTTGAPDYTLVVATVLYISGINGSFQANLTGLTDGQTYQIGVRAANATAEEKNTAFVTVVADATGPSAVVGLTAIATS